MNGKEEDVLDLFLTEEDFKKLLEEAGYEIHETGIIIDKDTGQPVKSETGKEVNLKQDKNLAVVAGGSHVFVKNVAEFSHLLARKNVLTYEKV
jgi:hypothetical protein